MTLAPPLTVTRSAKTRREGISVFYVFVVKWGAGNRWQ